MCHWLCPCTLVCSKFGHAANMTEDLNHLCAYMESAEGRGTCTHIPPHHAPFDLWCQHSFAKVRTKWCKSEHTHTHTHMAGQWRRHQEQILPPTNAKWFTDSLETEIFQSKISQYLTLLMASRQPLPTKLHNDSNVTLIGFLINTNDPLISCPGAENKRHDSSSFGGRNYTVCNHSRMENLLTDRQPWYTVDLLSC